MGHKEVLPLPVRTRICVGVRSSSTPIPSQDQAGESKAHGMGDGIAKLVFPVQTYWGEGQRGGGLLESNGVGTPSCLAGLNSLCLKDMKLFLVGGDVTDRH